MPARGVMRGFPPDPSDQVTLANWRTAPFNRWAFHHVRELLPSAEIRADPRAVWSIRADAEDLDGLAIRLPSGRALSFAGWLEATDTDALVVLRDGAIAVEHYTNGMEACDPHILMSVSKSLLGLLAGALWERGLLDPAMLVTEALPELADTAYRDATVRDLLDMRAGVAFDEDYAAASGPIIEYRKATNWNPLEPGEAPSDLRGFFASLKEADGRHGGRFHYVSPNTDLLGWVFERVSGRRYADLVGELLWHPLGAEASGYVTVDRLGAPRCAGGVCVTARDLARLGQLVLQDGVRDGVRVIPADWIADIRDAGDPEAWRAGSFTDLFPAPGMRYRSKWYVDLGEGPLLFGFGIHGQMLAVDLSTGIVMAKLSSQALPIDPARVALTLRGLAAIRARLAVG